MATRLIEVRHNTTFQRYLMYDNESMYIPGEATRLLDVDKSSLPPSRRKIYEQIYDELLYTEYKDKLEHVFFMQAKPIYVNIEENIMIDINDTQDVLFNMPLNLLYAAASVDNSNVIYTLPKCDSHIRVVRHHMCMVVTKDDGYLTGYNINAKIDVITLNQLLPRSVEFQHTVQLTRNEKFVSKITNGNIMLAFADIYYNNLDDDVIVINNPMDGIESIRYDQFSGCVVGNHVEIITNNPIDPVRYDADKIDNGLVETLMQCIAANNLNKDL